MLAGCHANVYLLCRNETKTRKVIDELKAATGNDNIHFIELDLEKFSSVRAAAKTFDELDIPLHVLMLNAGVMAPAYTLTVDGHESQWQTNHLSHFLLTLLLLPRLRLAASAASPARVISVSSSAHAIHSVNFDDLNFSNTWHLSGWFTYGQSKTANILFASEFNRRYAESDHIVAFSLHPGVISTELQRHISETVSAAFAYVPFLQSIPEGAATQVFLAVSPIETLRPGQFYQFSKPSQPRFSYASDPAIAERLWTVSLSQTGLSQTDSSQ